MYYVLNMLQVFCALNACAWRYQPVGAHNRCPLWVVT